MTSTLKEHQQTLKLDLTCDFKNQGIFQVLDTTFQNNKKTPLHNWFPYLEGFGPTFVNAVYDKYLNGAQSVLDPFLGSGTTLLALSQRDVECAYCEANPVMRDVALIKYRVSALDGDSRLTLSKDILELSNYILTAKPQRKTGKDLLMSYPNCFGSSIFFKDEVLTELVTLRSLADGLSTKNALLSSALVIAVLSKIVLCSRLKRAGDVRYKSPKELKKSPPSLIVEVSSQLKLMADECLNCEIAKSPPVHLSDDARSISSQSTYNCEGVITSPPYLNGTNYIRNTKLELWFTRHLKTSAGLRSYRDSVVTSGINDVTKNHSNKSPTASTRKVVDALIGATYDQRIPKMVAKYFTDMSLVFEGLVKHTIPGSFICVDIGDSKYAGIHVPTDELLVETAEISKLSLHDSIYLRHRLSKDKSKLSQRLLVFKNVKD